MTSLNTGRLRVARLELTNFKGLQDEHILEFDADLVLLVGPNGRGKTSIVEALEVALTGEVGQRVGDAKEFRVADLINTRADEARVGVVWSGLAEPEQVLVTKKARDPISTNGPATVRRSQGLWAIEDQRRLMRAATFLYSDSLGSLLGLDLNARKRVLDFYMPEAPNLARMTSQEVNALRALVEDARRSIAGLPDLRALEQRVNEAAVLVEECWQAVHGEKLGIVAGAKQRKLGVEKALSGALEKMGISTLNDAPRGAVIRTLAEAATTRAQAQHRAAVNDVKDSHVDAGGWADLVELLRGAADVLVSDERAAAALAQLDDESVLSQRVEEERERNERLVKEQIRLWEQVPLQGLPDGAPGVTLGAIPLLASLARLAADSPVPEWWKDAGLPAPNPERFALLRDGALARWHAIAAEKADSDRLAADAQLRITERRRIERDSALAHRIEDAWHLATPTPAPRTNEGLLDVAACRRVAKESLSLLNAAVPDEDPGTKAWIALATALAAWASAQREQEEAEQEHQRNPRRHSAIGRLDAIQKLAEHIANEKSGFRDRLRAEAVRLAVTDELNQAMRSVLMAYAHLPHFMDGARLEFAAGGSMRVVVGSGDERQIGISSLSRSQLTSLVFGLNLAMNLGHPELPSGFICLDDVSDVFDLANLTADAAVLRLLAYGPEPTKRQLILTNHNEQLTDRILPLLLPPAGRSMRVIELQDGGDQRVRTQHWRVRGEERHVPSAFHSAGSAR